MPRMGQSMDEGRVLRWLKDIGEEVKRGGIIAEIETDKAGVEMESFVTGTVVEVIVPSGETVRIGTVIAIVDDGRPEPEAASVPEAAPSISAPLQPAAPPTPVPATETGSRTPRGERVDASPVAKRLAREHGIDLSQVKGTGPGGRIVKEDIEVWLAAQRESTPMPTEAAGVRRVALTRIKQTTARRMAESKATVPHFYISVDIEMSQALALRDSLQARGWEISVNDLVLKATALALTRYPTLNATFAGNELHVHPHINLAIAVALDEGLITPVVHNCESLSLTELAAAAKGVIERGRHGRVRPEDLEGGTFTVSNLGMFGVKHFEAIVNPTQAAILAVGEVRRVPTFDAYDRVVPAQLLAATVSADHRVTDGAEVARFLQELKGLLEDGFGLTAES